MEKEYILFCDESDQKGAFYSHFFGGVIVGASQYEQVSNRLDQKKSTLNLHSEVKWQKVTDNYLSKYQELMTAFFDEMRQDHVKVRIMFQRNATQAVNLKPSASKDAYWKLYYQFVKHALGFADMPTAPQDRWLRVYFDEFPDTGEQVVRFKGLIEGLGHSTDFRRVRLRLRREDITEVRSDEHVLLQCLDVVLGAM
ncbi:MAG: DUF3800 domain-containing protein, partial [Gemmataceae bacterium]